ncbi:hypothetical protein LPJ66_000316 [Kickxella alabastrina]|uniref:Uncharacterized protein n=1 Tax=Kickxella alabastrina TaxID=61397 RepID=A0ACC1IWQ0_9FUNG|nr:hypothetical protein LPJ66_000316 [Kickxella alabastrina]
MSASFCTDVSQLSHKCAFLSYSTTNSSYASTPDALVTQLVSAITKSLSNAHLSGSCRKSILALSCSVVLPECPSANARLPHYSELLNHVAASCRVSVDDLSDRLLRTAASNGNSEWFALVDMVCVAVFFVVACVCAFYLLAQGERIYSDLTSFAASQSPSPAFSEASEKDVQGAGEKPQLGSMDAVLINIS